MILILIIILFLFIKKLELTKSPIPIQDNFKYSVEIEDESKFAFQILARSLRICLPQVIKRTLVLAQQGIFFLIYQINLIAERRD